MELALSSPPPSSLGYTQTRSTIGSSVKCNGTLKKAKLPCCLGGGARWAALQPSKGHHCRRAWFQPAMGGGREGGGEGGWGDPSPNKDPLPPNCWWGHISAGIYQHQILGVSVYSAQSEANRRCDVHAASICEQAEQGLWKDPRTPLKRSEVRSREGFWEPEKTPGSKHPCRDRRDPRCGMPSLPPPLQPPSGPFFCLVALTRLMVHGDKTVAPAGKFPPPPVCIQFLRNEKSQPGVSQVPTWPGTPQ